MRAWAPGGRPTAFRPAQDLAQDRFGNAPSLLRAGERGLDSSESGLERGVALDGKAHGLREGKVARRLGPLVERSSLDAQLDGVLEADRAGDLVSGPRWIEAGATSGGDRRGESKGGCAES